MKQKLALNIKKQFHFWRYSTPRETASQTDSTRMTCVCDYKCAEHGLTPI